MPATPLENGPTGLSWPTNNERSTSMIDTGSAGPALANFDELLGLLYEAVLAPEGFQAFTEACCESFNLKAVLVFVRNSETQLMFRGFLFQRIVPVLRDIGLFGDRIKAAFTDMGVMGFADSDLDALVAEDEAVAEEFDRMRHVKAVATEA